MEQVTQHLNPAKYAYRIFKNRGLNLQPHKRLHYTISTTQEHHINFNPNLTCTKTTLKHSLTPHACGHRLSHVATLEFVATNCQRKRRGRK